MSARRPSAASGAQTRFSRAAWLVAAGCGAVLLLELVWVFRIGLDEPWNDARLAPTVAMLHGYPLWPRPGEGPLLDNIYGPVAALAWLPAAVQATPARAVGVGLAQAFLFVMLPLAWILHIEARRDRLLLTATLLLALGVLFSIPSLPGLAVHADAPALGLATFSLACVWTEGRRRHPGWRTAGAAAVVLAAGTKQVTAPLLVAYPLWIAVTSGRRAGRHALAAVVVLGAAALLVVVLTVDVRAMVLGTVVGPSRQPWSDADPVRALGSAGLDLVRLAAPSAAMLALAFPFLAGPTPSWRAIVRRYRWVFPIAVVLLLIPAGLLGRVKAGGGTNSLISTWFVTVAMLAAYASAARRGPTARAVLTTVALATACVLGGRLAWRLADLPALLRATPLPTLALRAVTAAPGSIHFPLRPSIPLIVEGRGDHFTSGITFRRLEGEPIDQAIVRAFLPPDLERVAVDRRYVSDVLDYLPRFRRQVHDEALPGWIVLTRDDAVGDAEVVAEAVVSESDPRGPLAVRLLGTPGAPARLDGARVLVTERDRRYRLGLTASIGHDGTPPDLVGIEVRLRDAEGRLVLTLADEGEPDGSGVLTLEWPVLDDFARAADHAVVLIRSLRLGTRTWRLSAGSLRAQLDATTR